MNRIVNLILGLVSWGSLAVILVTISGNPNERTLLVPVTTESYDKARQLCERYQKGADGFTTGQVAVYTSVGEHISMPCRIVLRQDNYTAIHD